MDKIISQNIKKMGELLLDFLYPPRCPICDEILQTKELCCPKCAKALPWVREPACMKCGKPVGSWEQEYCPDCQKVQHFFDQGAAAFTYTGKLRHSVYRMKAENRRDYIAFYGESMARVLHRYLPYWKPEAVIPAPMHWKKKQARGYNQSELLAEQIAWRTGLPVDKKLIKCVKYTAAQKTLDRKARRENLRGSYRIRKQPEYRSVLVVDDVYTTGSTMDEISRSLKNAGIEQVYFLVLCIGKGKKTVCIEENL